MPHAVPGRNSTVLYQGASDQANCSRLDENRSPERVDVPDPAEDQARSPLTSIG